ncbi:MAG: polyprenyl synthetase family protein [Burkholderiaceae bacterium]
MGAGVAFDSWMGEAQARAEAALAARLPRATEVPTRLHEAMRYAVLDGGKRVRPLLVYATGEATGRGEPAALDAVASAVELIHAYSLVHDDLPCMDDDDLRRGKPTVHRRFDEATAMLVGDALQALAFGCLATLDARTLAPALGELASAAGSRGMAGGQAIDLASVGAALDRPALEQMHRLKTGALLGASVRLGWLAASQGEPAPAELERYSRATGLAFQVVDDILDVEGDAASLGKTAGKDAAHDKPTYVSLLGLAGARQLAGELHQEALGAVQSLGQPARRLRELADLIVLRKH